MGRCYRRCGAEMRGVAMARIPSSRRKPGSQRRVIARYRDPGFRRDDDYPATVLLRRLLGLDFRLAPSALGRGGGDFDAERVADLGVLAFLHPPLTLAAVDELAEQELLGHRLLVLLLDPAAHRARPLKLDIPHRDRTVA